MADLHPTLDAFLNVVQSGKKEDLIPLLAEDVLFKPPTYWKEWSGKEITARILSHVALIFKEFKYHRTIGEGQCFFLEFHCKVNGLDAVGVDIVTLDDAGLIKFFEVVMRPHKTVGELRKEMNTRTMQDPFFQKLAFNR